MHPTLFFPFIHSYGLMLAVGFYAGWWLAARRARREGIDPDLIGNLVLISILAGVVGSRLLWYALEGRREESIWVLIKVWEGGLVFYGGLISAIVADYVYLTRKQAAVWQVADTVAPAVALGQAFGRIGCFLNGCCYGGISSTAFPLRVSFPGAFTETWGAIGSAPFREHVNLYHSHKELHAWFVETHSSLPVHPTQLYEAASLLLLTALLVAASPWKRRQGEIFALLCILNAVSRFAVELVRRDTQPVLISLSPGQVGAIIVFAIGVGILLWVRHRACNCEQTKRAAAAARPPA
ncbi:MAG: prolipoprotein diacylglyceryl transferase [Planctomycetes bacterium]|nr:prolipoprotein diacylglyceryl transferase [Planctomycetota bacterium]